MSSWTCWKAARPSSCARSASTRPRSPMASSPAATAGRLSSRPPQVPPLRRTRAVMRGQGQQQAQSSALGSHPPPLPSAAHLSRPVDSMRETDASMYAPCASMPPTRLPARECPPCMLSQDAALPALPAREWCRCRPPAPSIKYPASASTSVADQGGGLQGRGRGGMAPTQHHTTGAEGLAAAAPQAVQLHTGHPRLPPAAEPAEPMPAPATFSRRRSQNSRGARGSLWCAQSVSWAEVDASSTSSAPCAAT